MLVKDINPGNEGSFPFALGVVGETLFFAAFDPRHWGESSGRPTAPKPAPCSSRTSTPGTTFRAPRP